MNREQNLTIKILAKNKKASKRIISELRENLGHTGLGLIVTATQMQANSFDVYRAKCSNEIF